MQRESMPSQVVFGVPEFTESPGAAMLGAVVLTVICVTGFMRYGGSTSGVMSSGVSRQNSGGGGVSAAAVAVAAGEEVALKGDSLVSIPSGLSKMPEHFGRAMPTLLPPPPPSSNPYAMSLASQQQRALISPTGMPPAGAQGAAGGTTTTLYQRRAGGHGGGGLHRRAASWAQNDLQSAASLPNVAVGGRENPAVRYAQMPRTNSQGMLVMQQGSGGPSPTGSGGVGEEVSGGVPSFGRSDSNGSDRGGGGVDLRPV